MIKVWHALTCKGSVELYPTLHQMTFQAITYFAKTNDYPRLLFAWSKAKGIYRGWFYLYIIETDLRQQSWPTDDQDDQSELQLWQNSHDFVFNLKNHLG